MKKKLLFATIISLVAICLAALRVSPTFADSTTGQALEIAPPLIALSADPGTTLKTQIDLRNISNGSLVVDGKVNDFKASDSENGNPTIITDENVTTPYSIKSWISGLNEMTMTAKQLKALPITISVPANAAPGGYYGVVRFTATPPELKGTGMSLSASLGTLVMIRVKGQANEQLAVKDFYAASNNRTSSLFESIPIDFTVRLQNTGNMYEQPTGQITISDMFNKKIASINVNLSKYNILPDSTRKFTQALDSSVIGKKILFGKYTASLKMVYGTNNTVLTKTLEFWIIPYKMIIAIIIIIVIVFLFLKTSIRRYNDHIISRAQRSQYKPRR